MKDKDDKEQRVMFEYIGPGEPEDEDNGVVSYQHAPLPAKTSREPKPPIKTFTRPTGIPLLDYLERIKARSFRKVIEEDERLAHALVSHQRAIARLEGVDKLIKKDQIEIDIELLDAQARRDQARARAGKETRNLNLELDLREAELLSQINNHRKKLDPRDEFTKMEEEFQRSEKQAEIRHGHDLRRQKRKHRHKMEKTMAEIQKLTDALNKIKQGRKLSELEGAERISALNLVDRLENLFIELSTFQ